MSPCKEVLHGLHAWFVLVGSASAFAFLACVFADTPPGEPSYAYVRVDGMRCLVDDEAGTLVARDDGTPECVQDAPAPVRLARR